MAKKAVIVAATVTGYLFSAWLGGASVAAYNRSDGVTKYGFNEPVELGLLWSDMLAVPLIDVFRASSSSSTLPFTSALMLGMTLAALVHVYTRSTSSLRLIIGAAVVGAPYGLLGLVTFTGPLDGEWLGEGWPLLQVFSLWWLVLVAVAVLTRGGNASSPAQTTDFPGHLSGIDPLHGSEPLR